MSASVSTAPATVRGISTFAACDAMAHSAEEARDSVSNNKLLGSLEICIWLLCLQHALCCRGDMAHEASSVTFCRPRFWTLWKPARKRRAPGGSWRHPELSCS